MLLDKNKTMLKIWPNPVTKLTSFLGTEQLLLITRSLARHFQWLFLKI